jgi:hypothetical protein
MWGSAPSTLWWSVPYFSLFGSLPLSKHIGDSYATPAFSCRLVYLQFPWESASSPLSGALGTPPYLPLVLFSVACLLFSFCFVLYCFVCWAVVSLARRLCWFFPGVAVEEPCAAYLLTCGSAKQVRSWCLVAREPSLFLCILWCGGAMCGLGVWRCQSFASNGGFSCPVCLQHLRKIFTWRNTCYLHPSSRRHLGKNLNHFILMKTFPQS